MKAMLLHGSAPIEESPLRLEDVPDPVPRAGEVLVRVTACGICRTDLHVVEGDLAEARRPVIPGHQIVGTVERIGGAVPGLAIGERVGVAWLQGTCGRCEYCAEGSENLCERPTFTGYSRDGGFAELVVAPAAWTHPIPEIFGDEEA